MQNLNQNKKSLLGFTLMEFLIYVAILGGLTVFVGGAFVSINRGGAKSDARYVVNSSIKYALNSIEQDAKDANGLLVPRSPNTSTTLQLQVGPNTVIYDVVNGRLRRNGQNITSDKVVVSAPLFRTFENLNLAKVKEAINLNAQLTASYNSVSTDSNFSETLTKTVLLETLFDWPARGSFGLGHAAPPGPSSCDSRNNVKCLACLPNTTYLLPADNSKEFTLFGLVNGVKAQVINPEAENLISQC